MKIKSIAAICKKSKVIYLYTKREEYSVMQYIGDGSTAYPLDGVPELDAQSIMTIFDIPEKQRDDWFIKEQDLPEEINFGDTDFSEKLMEQEKIQLIQSGKVLKALRSSHGVILIDSKYLAPVMDTSEVMEFYERVTPSGQRYVVIKAGFLLQAVVFPVTVGTIAEDLQRIEEGIRTGTEYEKMRASVIRPQEEETQISLSVDSETGEVLSGAGEE